MDDETVAKALQILESRLRYARGPKFKDPGAARQFARLMLAPLEHEVFACFWLDNQCRLIQYEELFRGTINGATVHPREVVKSALRHNAAAVIFAHNHPSGVTNPSEEDKRITRRLKEILAVVDVQVLDHIVVGEDTTSMAELGLL